MTLKAVTWPFLSFLLCLILPHQPGAPAALKYWLFFKFGTQTLTTYPSFLQPAEPLNCTNSALKSPRSNFKWWLQSFMLYQSQFNPLLGALLWPELHPCSDKPSSACSIETQKESKVTPEATKWEPSWTARWCPTLKAVSSLLALTSHCMWGGMFLICSLQLLEREQGRKRVGDG